MDGWWKAGSRFTVSSRVGDESDRVSDWGPDHQASTHLSQLVTLRRSIARNRSLHGGYGEKVTNQTDGLFVFISNNALDTDSIRRTLLQLS